MSKVIIPALVGEPVSETREVQIGDTWMHQNVLYKGLKVRFKDGTEKVVFEDFDTFGKPGLFPKYSDVLEFLENTVELPITPFPALAVPPMEELLDWSLALPFDVPGVWIVDNLQPLDRQYLPLPTVAQGVEVTRVEWIGDKGVLVPHLHLSEKVTFMGELTDRINVRSLVYLKAKKLGAKQKVLVFETWVKPLSEAQVRWPTRCPKCNTPTKEVGYHLLCGRCKERA